MPVVPVRIEGMMLPELAVRLHMHHRRDMKSCCYFSPFEDCDASITKMAELAQLLLDKENPPQRK
jgi:hypothetical protein